MIRGLFSATHPGQANRALTAVPLLDAELWLPAVGKLTEVRFLLDTGADMTVLHPSDSTRLLASEADWNVIRRFPRQAVSGAGQGLAHYLVPAVLTLRHTDREVDRCDFTLWIAPPDDRNRQHESLLGRDILSRYTVTFDRANAITLERPA